MMNTFILIAFVVIVGLRGALAIVRQRSRAGAYGGLSPLEGQRAVWLGVSNVIGAAAVLVSHVRPTWPDPVRTGLLWGGFFLIVVMETVAVVWARQNNT